MIKTHDGKTVSEMILEDLEPLLRQGISDGKGVYLDAKQCTNIMVVLSQSVPIEELVDTTARLIRSVLVKEKEGMHAIGH